MTRTVVDTSAIVALLYPDDTHNETAASLLHDAAERGALLGNQIVYAELAADPFFGSQEALDAFLKDTGIVVESIPSIAQFEAGVAFQTYLDRRGVGLTCSECGNQTTYKCPECMAEITARQHIASDFLIGAHAALNDALLTFDAGFYRDYFDVECLSIASD